MELLLCTDVDSYVDPADDDFFNVVQFDVKHRRVEEGEPFYSQIITLVAYTIVCVRALSVQNSVCEW